MVRNSSETKVRKLPLPLEIKVGDDTVVTDGLFSLTSKEASQIKIISIDEDGYVTCEIFPPLYQTRSKSPSLLELYGTDTLIGKESSKTRGRGKDFGQYKYYRRSDGSLYATVSGSRPHKFEIGKPTERNSPIWKVIQTIKHGFNTNEFSKKQLIPLLAKNLSYSQILKAILDVMKIEGYLQRREVKPERGRFQELFKATPKLSEFIIASSEQT